MRTSAVDNPRFLATTIGNFMGWRSSAPARSYAEATPPAMSDSAAYVFQQRCAACHTVGKGDTVGPDLAGVTTRRARGWLVRYLRYPDRMLAEKDPVAVALFEKYRNVPMPNLRLSESEIEAVLSFLEASAR
jgi:protein SCO1/2